MTYVDRDEPPSTLTEVEQEFDAVEPCRVCAEYQRGEHPTSGEHPTIHACERLPPNFAMVGRCLCGCSEVRELWRRASSA